MNDTTSGAYSGRIRLDANNLYFDTSTDGTTYTGVFQFELDTKRGFINGSQIWTNDYATAAVVTTHLGYTPADSAITVLSGNGLSGGGTLTTSRTITLGTPSTVTASTANAVTSTSHTHAVDASGIFQNGSAAQSLGGLGTYVLAKSASTVAPNASIAGSSLTPSSVDGNTSGTLSGTWRAMGYAASTTVFLRIA